MAQSIFMKKTKSALGKRLLYSRLKKMNVGQLQITYKKTNKTHFFGDSQSPIKAHMVIHDDYLIWQMITLGELGLGMTYVAGAWESESPYRVMLVLILNERHFRSLILKGYRLDIESFRIVSENHKKITNNKLIDHCRKQIGLTYDIGNDFYRHMLGKEMMYSCAIWPHPHATLDEAQVYKAQIIIDKLRIRPEDHVLDIGCGWGSLCNHIQQSTKAKVRGIALSHNQINACKASFPSCDFEYRDYREETGQYDKIVSVGMAEHVGRENIPLFIECISSLLKPGGLCLIHLIVPYDGILIDEHKTKYPSWSDVLMPNADCPTQPELIKATMATGTLRVLHTETFSIHYARTCAAWLDNLEKNKEAIVKSHSLEMYKAHEYAWHVVSAVLETGYCLLQMVIENKPFGSPLTDSVIDVVRSRASALAPHRS